MQGGGFAQTWATKMVREKQSDRLFGGPYLHHGVVSALACHFMLQGGVLGDKYRGNANAFGALYLNMVFDREGGFAEFCQTVADKWSMSHLVAHQQFSGVRLGLEPYVESGYQGMFDDISKKMKSAKAIEVVWEYALFGAIIGITLPGATRTLFEASYREASFNYEAVEENETLGLQLYGEQCWPEWYAELVKGQ
jgi:hypothetical protein